MNSKTTTSARQRIHMTNQALRLDASSESSARQGIYMTNQALFSLKDKSKKNEMSSAAIFVWRFKG